MGAVQPSDGAVDSSIPEFDRTVGRIIEDAQERLVFRTQIHLRDEVQNYEAKEDDLRYFTLLKELYADSSGDGDGDGGDGNEEKEAAERGSTELSAASSASSAGSKPAVSRYQDWSPVLERTLSVLSKVYPVLNHSVFEFVAYEAVSCCVASLVELARGLAAKLSTVHGHLFLIKHLLILRE